MGRDCPSGPPAKIGRKERPARHVRRSGGSGRLPTRLAVGVILTAFPGTPSPFPASTSRLTA
jgi:hypothetical protein